MSESTSTTTSEGEGAKDPDGLTQEALTPNDFFLELLLEALLGIEASDRKLGLTLMTPGGVISGEAVSLGSWVRALAETVSTVDPATGDSLTKLDVFVEQAKQDQDSRIERELPTMPVRFVHLKDAKIWAGSAGVSVGLWRGRISQISGWTLGQLVSAGPLDLN